MDMTSLELVRHGAPATAPTVDRDIGLEIDRLLEQASSPGNGPPCAPRWALCRKAVSLRRLSFGTRDGELLR